MNATETRKPEQNHSLGLVVFACADHMTSLQSICWCRATRSLDALCIYHTPATACHAEALRRFCARQWPDLKVIVPGEPGNESADKVVERLRDWRLFRAELSRWIVDCTGAAPTMLAGLARVAGEAPLVWTLIRHDETGLWQALSPAAAGDLKTVALPEAPASDSADGVSLLELLPLLAGDEQLSVLWRESRPAAPLRPEEVAAIVNQGAACNWNWRQMRARALEPEHSGEDWGFDDFIAASLAAMGCRTLRVHLRLRSGKPSPREQIFDVVALHHGRLWLFDCGCRIETDAARTDDVALWGLVGAGVVVLRPGRQAGATERTLAAAGRVTLIDRDDSRHLFTLLARLLSIRLDAALRQAEQRTLAPADPRRPALSPATPAQQFSAAIHLDDNVFDLMRGAQADAGGKPPPWLAARLASDLWYLGGQTPLPVPGQEMRRRFEARLVQGHFEYALVFFEAGQDRRQWRALVRIKRDDPALGRWLHRWRNVPIVV